MAAVGIIPASEALTAEARALAAALSDRSDRTFEIVTGPGERSFAALMILWDADALAEPGAAQRLGFVLEDGVPLLNLVPGQGTAAVPLAFADFRAIPATDRAAIAAWLRAIAAPRVSLRRNQPMVAGLLGLAIAVVAGAYLSTMNLGSDVNSSQPGLANQTVPPPPPPPPPPTEPNEQPSDPTDDGAEPPADPGTPEPEPGGSPDAVDCPEGTGWDPAKAACVPTRGQIIGGTPPDTPDGEPPPTAPQPEPDPGPDPIEPVPAPPPPAPIPAPQPAPVPEPPAPGPPKPPAGEDALAAPEQQSSVAWIAAVAALAGGLAVWLGMIVVQRRRRAADLATAPADTAAAFGLPPGIAAPNFISYNMRDKPQVSSFVTDVEKAGGRCWMFERDQAAAAQWAAEIVRALRQSERVIVFLTPRSCASPHVCRELTLADRFQKPILPVMLEPCDPPDDVVYFLASLHELRVFEVGEEAARRLLREQVSRAH